jgi:hypothetical protein
VRLLLIRQRQRCNREDLFGAHPQRFPARGENHQLRTACEQRCDISGGLEDLLEVVQHQQHLAIGQRASQALLQ